MRTRQRGPQQRPWLLGALVVSSCACITEYSISDALETGELVCEEGETICFGECINQLTDLTNCGGCGIECDDNEVCEAGDCVSACAPACHPTTEWCVEDECLCRPPFELCDDQCIDTDSDVDHCGECFAPCESGQVCAGGECLADCGELTDCGDDCVDISIHTQHCGGCNDPCSAEQICLDGVCIDAIEPEEECLACPCGACDFEPFTECCYDDFSDAALCLQEGAC